MSRLIDELNRVARIAPQPMGFRASHPVSSGPRMLLVASLAETGDADNLADCVAGADAVLLRITKSSLTAQILQKMARSLPEVPWGAWLEDINSQKIGTLLKAGCDFVVFTVEGQVFATPQDDKAGKILQLESSLGEGFLKAVNDLPVDAVFATGGDETDSHLTWRHLMNFQRLANSLTKPLLVPVPPEVSASELKTLWEAGVDGVVVAVSTRQPSGRIEELRRAIADLTVSTSRKRGKAEALLPRVGGGIGTIADEEEEEDYE